MNEPKPWEYTSAWKTRASFFSWLRGQLRKIDNKSPVKNEWKYANRIRIKNPNKDSAHEYIWGGVCENCKKEFKENDLHIDHIIPAGSLRDWDDVLPFMQRLLASKERRFLCIPCHRLVTHADNKGMSLQEAKIDKMVIAFKKLNATDQVKLLNKLEPEGEKGSNASQRTSKYRELIS